ncbi:MAG: pyruvate carboxylase subunit B [Chitinivibrionales bacterium]|nr:pyruvate carboxylase subunit B [Chitinivibrionales bacterium]MBD3356812.1 pyruvate carboxylase subunit B [Chitinivibrionales bacterium]
MSKKSAVSNKKNAAGKKGEDALHKIPLRITDTTLRDAHQSLWASRMRTEDILRIIDTIDRVGYYSLEVWGGVTFDVCLRFLRENPWERLRMIKTKAKNTPLQMLLRGQNLVGYRSFADDVVDRFIALACENGIDIFRVFDALNDTRNLEAAIKAVKKHGGHAQGTLCYTISPSHTLEGYVRHAREQVEVGIDSLCIRDMAGILSPIWAERLVSALRKEIEVPIQLHCHSSSGMATAAYVEGVRAGAGAIDCAISPIAGFSAQPPVETLATIFRDTNYSADLDFGALERVADYFAEPAPKRRRTQEPVPVIDTNLLIRHIPGGVIANLRTQLASQNAEDKLPDTLTEITRVRKDLGWPPMIKPLSQIVGTQAVMNVLAGERYKIVPNEIKNYVKGLYGRPAGKIDETIRKQILGEEKPISHRPADEIPPMLPTATKGLDPKFIESEEDIISYVILPEPSIEYFRWRSLPPEYRPKTPVDMELDKIREEEAAPQQETPAYTRPATEVSAEPLLPDTDYQGISALLTTAKNMGLSELTIKKGSFNLVVRSGAGAPPSAPGPESFAVEQASIKSKSAAVHKVESKPASTSAGRDGGAYTEMIKAPLVGTFYSAAGPDKPPFVKSGDIVKAGDTVCIIEAMKLFNEIKAPKTGKIAAILAKDGDAVEKDQPLIGFDPA